MLPSHLLLMQTFPLGQLLVRVHSKVKKIIKTWQRYQMSFRDHVKLYEVFLNPTNAASRVPVARKIALTVTPFRTRVADSTGITYTLTTLSFGDECFRITYISNLNYFLNMKCSINHYINLPVQRPSSQLLFSHSCQVPHS